MKNVRATRPSRETTMYLLHIPPSALPSSLLPLLSPLTQLQLPTQLLLQLQLQSANQSITHGKIQYRPADLVNKALYIHEVHDRMDNIIQSNAIPNSRTTRQLYISSDP